MFQKWFQYLIKCIHYNIASQLLVVCSWHQTLVHMSLRNSLLEVFSQWNYNCCLLTIVINPLTPASNCLRTPYTSVSSGQLNDDDHCLLVRAKFKKIYACALKRMARAVAGNSIKDNKALEMFLLPMASQKNATSVVANRRHAGIALLRILWKTWKIVFMWKHRAMMRACVLLVAEIWRGGDVVATNRGKNIL